MADYFQTVIDTQARPDEADHLARHIVAFLSGKGIIAANPDEEGGYSRAEHALDIADAASRLPHETIPPVYSHLQVMIGRATHAADMSSTERPRTACPSCGRMLEDPDELWRAAEQAWLDGDDASPLECPACGAGAPVAAWRYDARYGFGHLAFRFWNWPPLRADFLEELRRELGHSVALVAGKL